MTNLKISHHFGHWQRDLLGRNGIKRSIEGTLYAQLEELLPTLMQARDYRGAANVLSLLYSHFLTQPGKCITASLEILKRLPDTSHTLMEFHQSLLDWKNAAIDKEVILREKFLLYIFHGNFHEAYSFYKEHMQIESLLQDVHVIGAFGMVCFWLLFHEDQDLQDQYLRHGTFPVHHIVGTAALYQDALVSFRRAMTLSPENNVFLEYYIQILVMKNDVDAAADYLEHYYHMNSTEPHACRMLLGFLQEYFPESSECHVDICSRWNQLDPSARLPLEKLAQMNPNDDGQKLIELEAFCNTIDHCGSLFSSKLNHELVQYAWEQLATQLGPVGMPKTEFPAQECFKGRSWWPRIYFTAGSSDEISLVHAYKCVVCIHAFGAESPFVKHILEHIQDSCDPVMRDVAEEFSLDKFMKSTKPSSSPPQKRQKTEASINMPRGILRMPHVLNRSHIVSSFEFKDIIQVHEVAENSAPVIKITKPPMEIPLDDNDHLHPYDWLCIKRSGISSAWHMNTAASSFHDSKHQNQISNTNSYLTEVDAFTSAMEDELILDNNISKKHIFTWYHHSKLPQPPKKQAYLTLQTLRNRTPFTSPRVPARYLFWIQQYMKEKGCNANAKGCKFYLESQLAEHGGKCRGFPSIETITKVMNYFKSNAAILPQKYIDLFLPQALKCQVNRLSDLCQYFYKFLVRDPSSDMPYKGVLDAFADEWRCYGIPFRSKEIECYPPNEVQDHIILTEPVDEKSFLIEANQRYFSSIRTWLEDESPISNAALVQYMHIHFDSKDPDFPSPPMLNAMFDYVRIQLHAEFGEAPSVKDSIYWSIRKRLWTHLPIQMYFKQHPTLLSLSFEEFCLHLLNPMRIPMFTEAMPSLKKLFRYWKTAQQERYCSRLGLGSTVQTRPKILKTPAKPTNLIPSSRSRSSQQNMVMEIFPI